MRGDVRDLDALIGARPAGATPPFTWRLGAGVVQSIEEPLVNFDQNARGTLVALEAARRADVGRFVFSSSNAPLGDGAYPAREDKPVAPLSPYGASKAVGEAYCSAFHGAYGMHAVTVRFSNAYGPRSAHKGNVIPLFIRRLRAGEELIVYGDGEQTRDFVFCEDLADGLVRAAEADGAGGEIFQLASGVETSLNRLHRADRRGGGHRAADPPRAASGRRDPAQLLGDRQGPRAAGLRAVGHAGRGPARARGPGSDVNTRGQPVYAGARRASSALAKPMP